MKLTADQRAEIEEQRRSQPGRRSFRITLTLRQREERQSARDRELADIESNRVHVHRIEVAENEPTLSGTLRRAISECRRPSQKLSEGLGIEPRRLSNIRAGIEPLPSDVIDRLIALLGLDVIVADLSAGSP